MLTLGTVIQRLADKHNLNPIPYRDSKLTRLLRHSLEGNSKVVIICNIAPSTQTYDESLSTLKFAQRAKKIKQVIKKNLVSDNKVLILKYQNEINRLQEKISEMENQLTEYNPELVEEIGKLTNKLTDAEEEKEMLNAKLEAIFQEKKQVENELSHLRSLILVSEKLEVSRKYSLDTKSKLNEETLLKDLGVLSSKTKLVDASNWQLRAQQTREDLGKVESKDIKEAENKVPEVFPYKTNESLLTENIENIEEMLAEPESPKQDEVLNLVREQDRIITALQLQIQEKDDTISVLSDELSLCRTNLNNMKNRLREMKNIT